MTDLQTRAPADVHRMGSYTIGPWRFSAEDGVLHRAGVERRLEDRSARTLVLLCRNRGEVVSQQDILAAVWKGRVVSANSVAIVIGDIRRALDDDPRNPTHVEALPKRGYRLRIEASTPLEDVGQSRDARLPRRMVIVGAAAGFSALGLMVWRAYGPSSMRVVSEPLQNDTGRPDLDRLARALGMLVDLRLARIPGIVLIKGGAVRPDGLLFRSRLILWNDQPTLSLEAVDAMTEAVRWAGMANGPQAALASNTISQIERFSATRVSRGG